MGLAVPENVFFPVFTKVLQRIGIQTPEKSVLSNRGCP